MKMRVKSSISSFIVTDNRCPVSRISHTSSFRWFRRGFSRLRGDYPRTIPEPSFSSSSTILRRRAQLWLVGTRKEDILWSGRGGLFNEFMPLFQTPSYSSISQDGARGFPHTVKQTCANGEHKSLLQRTLTSEMGKMCEYLPSRAFEFQFWRETSPREGSKDPCDTRRLHRLYLLKAYVCWVHDGQASKANNCSLGSWKQSCVLISEKKHVFLLPVWHRREHIFSS